MSSGRQRGTNQRVGPYEIGRELGRGGQGAVYEARHVETGAHYAFKVCLDQDEEGIARFQREARLAQGVRSPGVVHVHDFGFVGSKPYYVMDLYRGVDLASVLRSGPLVATQALLWIAEVARSVHELHELGIVHRDLKPANLVLEGSRLRLIDFGLARPLGERSLTKTGDLIGTPAYMAPEQALAAKAVDRRADVYALGAILYHCLTGRPPFVGPTPLATLDLAASARLAPPSELDARLARCDPLLERALAKQPGERFLSALAFAEAAERLAHGAESSSEPSAPRASASSRAPLVLAGLLVVMAGVALPVALTPREGAPSPPPSARASPSQASTATITPASTATRAPLPRRSLQDALELARVAWGDEDIARDEEALRELGVHLQGWEEDTPRRAPLLALRAGLRDRRGQRGAGRDLARLLLLERGVQALELRLEAALGRRAWSGGQSAAGLAVEGLLVRFPSPEEVRPRLERWANEVAPAARAPLLEALTAAACGKPYAAFAEQIRAATALAPKDLPLACWRARLAIGRDQYHETRAALRAARELEPSPEQRALLARIQGDLGFRELNVPGFDAYGLARKLGGHDGAICHATEATFARVRTRVEALPILREGWEALQEPLRAGHPRAYAIGISLAAQVKGPYEALRLADEGIARGAAIDAQVLGWRAHTYCPLAFEVERRDLAQRALEDLLETSEGGYFAIEYAIYMGGRGELPRTLEVLRDCLRREPERPLLRAHLIRVLVQAQGPLEEVEEQVLALDRMDALDPELLQQLRPVLGEERFRALRAKVRLRRR